MVNTLALLALAGSLSFGDPGPPGDRLILRINLPERRLEVLEEGQVIRSYDATIGSPRFPTPTGGFEITRIEWNPWWVPPNSSWAAGKKKTPPGPRNPMGRAKIQFDRLLYVHGTSQLDQIGVAASHGCIRIANEDVLELARFLAERAGVLPDDVDRLEATPSKTRSVRLPEPFHLQIVYKLVEEVDGEVREHEDVYRRGLEPWERELLERSREEGGEESGREVGPAPGPEAADGVGAPPPPVASARSSGRVQARPEPSDGAPGVRLATARAHPGAGSPHVPGTAGDPAVSGWVRAAGGAASP